MLHENFQYQYLDTSQPQAVVQRRTGEITQETKADLSLLRPELLDVAKKKIPKNRIYCG